MDNKQDNKQIDIDKVMRLISELNNSDGTQLLSLENVRKRLLKNTNLESDRIIVRMNYCFSPTGCRTITLEVIIEENCNYCGCKNLCKESSNG